MFVLLSQVNLMNLREVELVYPFYLIGDKTDDSFFPSIFIGLNSYILIIILMVFDLNLNIATSYFVRVDARLNYLHTSYCSLL